MSTNNGDWIYEFMPKKEADKFEERMEEIEENASVVITLVMSARKNDVIELCETWDNAQRGDLFALMRVSSFMEHLVENMKTHLKGDEE